MCGISGVMSADRLHNTNIERSIQTISHRGPDDLGFFKSENCVLGMCRLSIIDVSSGQQPNYNADGSVVSVFNGEIYNFRELRSDLLSKGYKIAGSGDSAIIPFLYDEYGKKFVTKLQGMFAIAVFDSNKRELVLVRDRIGKKPLWYSLQNDIIFFSSEIKGLLKLGVQPSVNESVIPEFLKFGFVNSPRSAFKEIKQIPPATFLTFKNSQTKLRRYWNSSDVPEIKIDFEDAKNELLRLLRESVRTRLISERQMGAFLSGGIDSTIITALMQEEFDEPVSTFSIGFSEREFDESCYARDISIELGTKHHDRLIKPDIELILNTLPQVMDQPFADSSIIPSFSLSQFARERVVVALSGDGGDEAFAGYDRYRAGALLDKINPLLTFNPLPLLNIDRIESQKIRKLIKHSRFQPLFDRYIGFQSLFQSEDLDLVLSPELLQKKCFDDYDLIWNSIPGNSRIRRMQEFDINTYLPGDLMYKVDITSMSNSLEVRSPFLDYRVLEFGLSLPSHFKNIPSENKHILREIARELVTPELMNRRKMGFGVPLAKWLRGELKMVVSDVLLDRRSAQRGWYKAGKVEEILKLHQQGHQLDSLIWPMFMLELWAKTWIDG